MENSNICPGNMKNVWTIVPGEKRQEKIETSHDSNSTLAFSPQSPWNYGFDDKLDGSDQSHKIFTKVYFKSKNVFDIMTFQTKMADMSV